MNTHMLTNSMEPGMITYTLFWEQAIHAFCVAMTRKGDTLVTFSDSMRSILHRRARDLLIARHS